MEISKIGLAQTAHSVFVGTLAGVNNYPSLQKFTKDETTNSFN
jgi:hypothetical protein